MELRLELGEFLDAICVMGCGKKDLVWSTHTHDFGIMTEVVLVSFSDFFLTFCLSAWVALLVLIWIFSVS